MELHERLTGEVRESSDPTATAFSEIKNSIHMGVIEALGRQLFNAEIDPRAPSQWPDLEAAARFARGDGAGAIACV